MQYAHTFDPQEVLGVAAGASLQEIRTAYHDKVKKYHPDVGGDAWAFRVVVRAYEALSAARVAARTAEAPAPRRDDVQETEKVRAGVRDSVANPVLLVDVELLLLRYAMENPYEAVFKAAGDRNLSCSINVNWPSRKPGGPPPQAADAAAMLQILEKAFAPLQAKTKALAARASTDDGRFEGWLSFPSAARASEALRDVREALRAHGLGVQQWTREIVLPRGEA
jgi:curved DNA-binding protein CbpA